MATSKQNQTASPAPQAPGRLGTFAGVFTPSVLTILGIILFLRLGYVVGAAGTARALVIIATANLISVLTSISLSAVATNLKVKGGGDYYLISRTLGVEFGGAIGLVLFLAQAVSIAFYGIGFGEAVADLAPLAGLELSPRAVAAGAVAFLLVFAWMGADWATKFQYVVMALLIASLAAFFLGGIPRWDGAVFSANWSAPQGGPPFWVLFALFFPAVTGFTQGVSMSGDLRDPGKSLPLGTFMAVGVSILVYFGAALVFAGAMPNPDLAADYTAMKRLARFGFLVDAGVIAATLSSAMASFLGAPRILQSLSADRIFPFLLFFAKGSGPSGNPRRGVLLSAGIAFAAIALGNLDLIAPVVSMFFLISYGLLNYATYYEARTESPSFRPTFRWFHPRLSLLGGLVCLGVMLAIDPSTGVAAMAILFAIFQYLRRTAGPARWADSRRAHHLQRVRENLLAAGVTPEHHRDWRPQILAFSQDPERRPRLLRLASWLDGGSGLTTVVTLLEGRDLLLAKAREETEAALLKAIRENDPAAFPLVITTQNTEAAIHTLLQSHGIGPLRVNTILVNWLDPDSTSPMGFREFLFGRQLRTIHRLGCNIVVLHSSVESWERLTADGPAPARRNLDVWWSDDATGPMMLLFAYLITRDARWEDASIRLFAFQGDAGEEERREALAAVLEEARIEADLHILAPEKSGDDESAGSAAAVIAASAQSAMVFLPFRLKGNLVQTLAPGRAEALLEKLPTTALVLAAEDIDLGAEPEEGTAAERAAALDALAEMQKKADAAEKDAADAREAAEAAQENVAAARGDDDPEMLAQLESDAEKADQAAEKAARRAAKARVKAENAEKELEDENIPPGDI